MEFNIDFDSDKARELLDRKQKEKEASAKIKKEINIRNSIPKQKGGSGSGSESNANNDGDVVATDGSLARENEQGYKDTDVGQKSDGLNSVQQHSKGAPGAEYSNTTTLKPVCSETTTVKTKRRASDNANEKVSYVRQMNAKLADTMKEFTGMDNCRNSVEVCIALFLEQQGYDLYDILSEANPDILSAAVNIREGLASGKEDHKHKSLLKLLTKQQISNDIALSFLIASTCGFRRSDISSLDGLDFIEPNAVEISDKIKELTDDFYRDIRNEDYRSEKHKT